MRTRLLCISILLTTVDPLYAGDSWIRINQLGYLPDAVKVAVLISEEDTRVEQFQLRNAITNVVVFSGETKEYVADSLFLATGRIGNADLLKVENTGVEADKKGYIKVDEKYQTTKSRIWAFGDAIGKAMFKHVANKEAELVWRGFSQNHMHTLDYDFIPYAVYSWPQVASVGLVEKQIRERKMDYYVGEYKYIDTAKGAAMMEEEGYVKVLLSRDDFKILGTHIVGPYAPILIQEVINVINSGNGTVYPLIESMHIHPALTEVVQRAFYNIREPETV